MQNKTKKYRVRIKNICIPSNKLFQVPFKTEQIKRYKGISDSCITNDCFFQVMTVLGLRHYSLSRKDSLRVKKTKSSGVETRYAAVYLSLIFNATILLLNLQINMQKPTYLYSCNLAFLTLCNKGLLLVYEK